MDFWHSASKVHCALPRAYLDAGHRDGKFSLSAERRHFGLCKSKIVKHRIVFLRAHCGTQRIARTRNTLSMWTISSLARIFPYTTSIEILVATASATSFFSSAVMYLWGQLSYIERYCRFCFRGVISHFGSRWAEVSIAPRWHEARGENKKTRTYTHGSRETQKANGARSLKNVPRLCISTSL